jgi:Mating-type protein MAT alpha 1 HMG-box
LTHLTKIPAYYSALFRGLTQKARSGFIKEMWIEEPRKHFFTLIARAHCEVRDSYPGKLSFSRFLASTVEILPIVPVNLYMKAMGWELTTDTHGEPKLFRSNIPVDKSLNLTTNVSVGDIVEHCYKIGLVPRPAQALRPVRGQVLSMESAMAMSFAAAPNQNASSGNRKLVVGSETQQQVL